MRARPVRPNIYLPVVRFGVADSDWFTVLLISCASYLLPVPLGVTVFYVPLQMWTWLLATAGSIAFFNYVRIGRKPYWLQHRVKGIFLHHRQNRTLPNASKGTRRRSWVIDERAKHGAGDETPASVPQSREQTALMLKHNRQFQEALEEL